MTKREALIACLMVSAPANLITKAFLDAGVVNPDGDYTVEAKKEIDAAEFELLKVIITRPDIAEGDLSIKQNRAGIQSRLLYLAKQLGKESELQDTSGPSVDSVSPW